MLVPGHLDRDRVLGTGGKNFKFILESTGARLSLEVRDLASSESSSSGGSELMHVRILGGRGAKQQEAAALVRDLLESLGEPHIPVAPQQVRPPREGMGGKGAGGGGRDVEDAEGRVAARAAGGVSRVA